MILNIISPKETIHHEIVWLEINTPVGNMVIQKHHAPMIIELEPHKEIAYQLVTGKQQTIPISRGFVHVSRTEIKIIVQR